MMKKILLLTAMLVFALCTAVDAADFTPTKKVVLFYRVSDAILQAQNSDEDMAKGMLEFEKELRNHYGKRFVVQDIKRNTYQPTNDSNFYKKLVKPNQQALIVEIVLAGETTTSTQYQNAYGAQKTGYAPAVNVHLSESLPRLNGNGYATIDYGVKTYSSGTFTVGMNVYATETNPRKNVKNAVRASFRDACVMNEQINKYTNPAGYEMEKARFEGDFEGFEALYVKQYGTAIAEIQAFVEWCKKDPMYKNWIPILDTLPNIEQKIAYINEMKRLGYYKP